MARTSKTKWSDLPNTIDFKDTFPLERLREIHEIHEIHLSATYYRSLSLLRGEEVLLSAYHRNLQCFSVANKSKFSLNPWILARTYIEVGQTGVWINDWQRCELWDPKSWLNVLLIIQAKLHNNRYTLIIRAELCKLATSSVKRREPNEMTCRKF